MICAVSLIGLLLGKIPFAQAADNPSAPPPPSPALRSVHRALREFDRFLDHHPLPEDDLRLNPNLITDRIYLGKNLELNDFLAANPEVLGGLKMYPRYYLFRALLRQASVPVHYAEIVQLKSVLDAEPEMEKALNRDPESIRSPAFLRAHALLYEFLNQHAILRNAFSSHEDSTVQKS
jgi:hypothetical protein